MIRIETEAVTLAKIHARGPVIMPAGDYSVIRVIDEGCGIAPRSVADEYLNPLLRPKASDKGRVWDFLLCTVLSNNPAALFL